MYCLILKFVTPSRRYLWIFFQVEAIPVQMRYQCLYSAVMANSKLDYSFMSGILTVANSGILLPVTSILSLVLPSMESMPMWKIGMDCRFVLFSVTIWRVSWWVVVNFSWLAASLDMKFRPDPVSNYAQKVRTCIFTGMMAGRASSSATEVNTESTVEFPLSHMLVWCFPLHL